MLSLLFKYAPDIDLNILNKKGLLPLYLIIKNTKIPIENKCKLVRMFIDKGAKPYLQGKYGKTSMDAAIIYGNKKIIEYLKIECPENVPMPITFITPNRKEPKKQLFDKQVNRNDWINRNDWKPPTYARYLPYPWQSSPNKLSPLLNK